MVNARQYQVVCLLLFVVCILICRFYYNNIIGDHSMANREVDFQLNQKRESRLTANRNGHFDLNIPLSRNVGNDVSKMNPTGDWKRALKEIAEELRGKKMEFQCKNKTWRGNWLDCNTFPFVVRKPCLVYSFGINYLFGPDDAFASLGCDVFSFDPSMGNSIEHIRKSGAHFLPIGIAGTSQKRFSPRIDQYTKKNPSKLWTTKTLRDIMRTLGHQSRHIDYLKLDIEFYEWDVIENILRDNLTSRIKQIGLEFHIFPDTPKENIVRYLKIYKMFKDAGFRKFDSNLLAYDEKEKSKRMQSDCEFVNLKFDFMKYPVEK